MARIETQALRDSTAIPVDPLLTAREAAPVLGVSVPTFWRRVADGTVPKPIKLGALSRWPQSEILAVIEKAKAARTAA
ncbi:DNA-binding protein [Haematobacter massiliensis]|uniref:DNA-binding protein n=1 Tax=Haematobacter massiliensis TaxID=195105 RepID=A0A086Y054_9RHOB|nr:AlpA family transcriptional regulator [Haematobacter massiliensis]KFI27654.1 DNA-binding protein [Haematobacter massiliensis]OWJ83186.1 DNA-binding protein [Haematobacter massiliensis]QBJ24007.1 AlpA family transcriptional regulator [Haematobacter massiliensis]